MPSSMKYIYKSISYECQWVDLFKKICRFRLAMLFQLTYSLDKHFLGFLFCVCVCEIKNARFSSAI